MNIVNNTSVPVNPEILRWARVRAGYLNFSVPGFAEEKVKSWEEGGQQPTLTEALALAEKYHRTVPFFFLPEPPEEEELPDFRDAVDRDGDPALQAFIHQVLVRCEWAEETRRLDQEKPAAYQWIGSGSMQKTPEQAAAGIHKMLAFDREEMRHSKSPADMLEIWIRGTEKAGIFVFQNDIGNGKSINRSQFGGLAVATPLAPAIGLNNQSTDREKVLMLAHELAHLWLGEGGISSMKFAQDGSLARIEELCFRTAVGALKPKDDFFTTLPGKEVASLMKVSLVENGQGNGEDGEGDREQQLAKQAGRLFSRMLIAAYRAEEVNPTVARKLLNADDFDQIDAIAQLVGLPGRA